MKKLKELFTKSRFSIGAAAGVAIGFVMDPEMGGWFGGVLVGWVILVVAENLFFKKE